MQHNTLILTPKSLFRSIESLFEEVRSREGRIGIPTFIYSDEHDHFEITIENTNLGFSVSITLNGVIDMTLNSRFFWGGLSIGEVMLHSAKAPKGSTIKQFFEIN